MAGGVSRAWQLTNMLVKSSHTFCSEYDPALDPDFDHFFRFFHHPLHYFFIFFRLSLKIVIGKYTTD